MTFYTQKKRGTDTLLPKTGSGKPSQKEYATTPRHNTAAWKIVPLSLWLEIYQISFIQKMASASIIFSAPEQKSRRSANIHFIFDFYTIIQRETSRPNMQIAYFFSVANERMCQVIATASNAMRSWAHHHLSTTATMQ